MTHARRLYWWRWSVHCEPETKLATRQMRRKRAGLVLELALMLALVALLPRGDKRP
jgi:hypothetical protein